MIKFKTFSLFIIMLIVFFSLSGCLYPGDAKTKAHIPYESEIRTVQYAVDQFKKDTGVLPIKNFTETTPLYEKYRIDFKKLMPKYLAALPVNSYENGGYYQYVIVKPDTKPTVKVFDLTLLDKVQEVQDRVNVYRYQHGYSPLNGVISKDRFKISYKDLGYKTPPYVNSPYSDKLLDFVMDENSKIYIDYGPDLFAALKTTKKHFKPGEDIRALLVDSSPVVPVKSLPYTIKNNEPVFLVK